jgi:tetratricopeptide (TPR) repeat protein
MKKIAILLLAALPSIAGYAQPNKVVSAWKYLKDFNESKDIESLNKAKDAIDLASANADTKDQTKTQVYRGQVYLTLFDNNLRTQTEKQTSITDPNKKTLVGYQNTPSAELDAAYVAFAKAKTTDVKNDYSADIKTGLARIGSHFENKAIADYNAKKFADALPSFERAYEINGAKDTGSLSNCALVAERAGMYDKAKLYYNKMIDGKQGAGNTYSSLLNVYLMMKDTTAGMDILKKGRSAYPNDINLLISETNFYLKTNNSKEALNNLNLAVAAKPTDANLLLVRGNIYDNLANPKDAAGKDMDKPKDYADKMALAEADYKKAIELKPNYFDALYNLGVLYNNKGVMINKQADKITDNAKYKIEGDKATAEFNKAMPVLEKALEVNPTDRNSMVALKQIYSRLQLLDKLKAINEKLGPKK